MTARHAGGHQRIRQQQHGRPESQKKRRSQGRLPPGSVEHPNERVQKHNVKKSAERGKRVNPTAACPVVPPRGPERCEFLPSVVALEFGGSPSDVIAEEHVQEDERRNEEGKPQQDRSQLQWGSRRSEERRVGKECR